jgi:hypothetical protein
MGKNDSVQDRDLLSVVSFPVTNSPVRRFMPAFIAKYSPLRSDGMSRDEKILK